MDHLKIFKKSLQEELKKTEEILVSTKISRNNSPSAMESHSDETRSRLERVVTMLENKVKEINNYIRSVPTEKQISATIQLWSYTDVELPNGKLKIFIVPEGLGGKQVEGIKFISSKTPIGLALLGKKVGEDFSFNDLNGKVISID